MPRNEHLPICKAAYDLCLWLEQVVRGFSRYHKHPIANAREAIAWWIDVDRAAGDPVPVPMRRASHG